MNWRDRLFEPKRTLELAWLCGIRERDNNNCNHNWEGMASAIFLSIDRERASEGRKVTCLDASIPRAKPEAALLLNCSWDEEEEGRQELVEN